MRKKLTELPRKTEESTVIVGYFNIHLSEMDRSRRQKTSKDTVELRDTNWIYQSTGYN